MCNSKDHIRDPAAPSLLLRIPFSISEDRRTDRPSNRNLEKRDSVTAETSRRSPRRKETFADIRSAESREQTNDRIRTVERRPRCHRQNRRRPGSHATRAPLPRHRPTGRSEDLRVGRNNTALVDWCIPKRPGLDRYIDILLGSPAKMMSRRTEKRYGASYNRRGRNRSPRLGRIRRFHSRRIDPARRGPHPIISLHLRRPSVTPRPG